jgi:4a-hydroxytetrahydrobiopterin dehydratase
MWQETGEGLYKRFEFTDFKQAFAFLNRVAEIAERQGHHPRLLNEWNVVEFWLSTHSAGGEITSQDRILADAIDAVEHAA